MRTDIVAVLTSALLSALLAIAAENAETVPADRISIFKVPLVCPAAPQIGCGSASKPILLDLEKQPGVLEAPDRLTHPHELGGIRLRESSLESSSPQKRSVRFSKKATRARRLLQTCCSTAVSPARRLALISHSSSSKTPAWVLCRSVRNT